MAKLIKSNFVKYDDVFVIGKDEDTNLNQYLKDDDKDDCEQENEINIKISQLEDMKNKYELQAKEIIQNARDLSDEILAKANEESKNIIESANERASKLFTQKEKEGFENGYRKYDNLLKEARNILEDAEEYKKNSYSNQEKNIIGLIIDCVNKIIRQKLDESDELVTKLILSSIEDLNSRQNLIVKISGEDFDSTVILRKKILATFPAIKDVEIKIVENYKKGDIEIESDNGVVNPSIRQQCIKLREEFSKLLEGE